ncbi:MAG: VOC family protein [Bacteroidia bacterium]
MNSDKVLSAVHPKLPMRDKAVTRAFYIDQLGFRDIGAADFDGYLILKRDEVELHFFAFPDLIPLENYGQVYIRVTEIEALYQDAVSQALPMPAGVSLQVKPWGQKEFSLLDPDHNLLTFGQGK